MEILVNKLKHHPLNKEIYRLSSIEELSSSIKEMGLLEPLVIDKKNQVISGNRRLEAIRRVGLKKVEVKRVDISDKEVGLHLVHYNKHRIKTAREILNESSFLHEHFVLQNKSNTRDLVSKELGIGSSTLGKLRVIQKHDDCLIDLIDKDILTVGQAYLQVQRVKKEAKTLQSSSKKNKLNGDGFTFYKKSSDQMDELKDGEVQTIFTSPPYWNKRKYVKGGSIGEESSPYDYVNNMVNHLRDCKRVLSKEGSFFLNLGDTYLDGNLQNIPHQVVIGLQEQGWILRNTIIWSKTNPKPSSSKSNLCPTYEFIFHLVKDNSYYYNLTLAPLKDSTKASLPPRHKGIKSNGYSSSPYIPREGKNMGDFWSEDIVKTAVVNQKLTSNGNEHPAPFPENIVTLPILQSSQEGDLVLDLFMGAGTTGRVANKFNRRFVGYDLRNY